MSLRAELLGVLRHPTEAKLLLLRSGGVWRLPRTLTTGNFSNAAAVADGFEQRLGTRPWLLRRLAFREQEEKSRRRWILELELLDRDWRPPRHGRWAGPADLEGLRLVGEDLRPLLSGYLEELERDAVPPLRAPWARPHWRERVRAWIETEARRLGHRVTGVEQVKSWSISTILRVRTDGPVLYLKVPARLPLFVEEGVVTAALAELFPGHVPAPLAVEPEEGWFLLADLGEPVGWDAPLDARIEMVRRFAMLQRRGVALVERLLAAGCLDRRLDVLESQLGPLLAAPTAVARLEPKEVEELRAREPQLVEACRRLAAIGLPDTLVHGDLHLGNVARQDGELVYFDWTDACVAQPLTDLHTLQWERDATARAALLGAYLAEWEDLLPLERLHEAAALAAVVTPLHHAVSYHQIVMSVEPVARGELDATHEFLREALEKLGAMPDA